jgi:hypothetical protein
MGRELKAGIADMAHRPTVDLANHPNRTWTFEEARRWLTSALEQLNSSEVTSDIDGYARMKRDTSGEAHRAPSSAVISYVFHSGGWKP